VKTLTNHHMRRSEKPDKPARLGYRIAEWSRLTGTSRVTTWRNIKNGKLKAVDYCGIKMIPESERARFFQH
jgi:hypothetical protein